AGVVDLTPNGPLVRRVSARLPAAIIAFDGTQPVLRHAAPIGLFSISTPGTPSVAPAAATDSPAAPPPMTQRSGVRCSGMSKATSAERRHRACSGRCGARTPEREPTARTLQAPAAVSASARATDRN